MPTKEDLYKAACSAIDQEADDLHELSRAIWSKPELNYEEHEAHATLTNFLEKKGFPMQRAYKIDTAFRSDYGKGSKSVAILCEYDALPEIGHACGHNLIAEAGVAASLGVKAAMDEHGLDMGTLVVLGTPAEEGGGGKELLLQRDGFQDVACAMMVHPTSADISRCQFLAIDQVRVTYHGKASHASGFPWEGVNALDAAVMAYNSISCMRQQMKPTWRVHGIFSNGGAKPNIIPETAELYYYVRAPNFKELSVLKEKTANCFKAAASATGCTVDIQWEKYAYRDVIHNDAMVTRFESHLDTLGVKYEKQWSAGVSGSTDMGNVSYTVPSIHPMFYIGSDAANHTRDFTAAAGDPKAQSYTLKNAKAMAMTAIDIMCEPDLLDKMKQDFQEDTKANA